jgi:DNA-binding MarR family transcriptional regulator
VQWLEEEEQAAWRGWVRASHRIAAAVARDLHAGHELSDAEYAVLVALSEAPDHIMRMGTLAASLDWSRSRLSHLLSRMEGRGLVVREGCASDARGAFARLTAAGMDEITRAAPDHVDSVRRHFLDLLDAEQIRQLGAITAALLANAPTAYADDTCPDEEPGCQGAASACDGTVSAG